MNGKNGTANEGLQGKTILLVNTGSIKKRFILQQLKKLGIKIVVLNKEKNWAQSYIDQWILTDTGNFKDSIQAIREYLKQHPETKIDGTMTFWEDDVLLTAKITDTFNFIGIPFQVAQRARNKFLFREFCAENGIRAPQHALLRSNEDCKSVAENFTFPLVIKPAYGASSAYVVKVKNEEELYNTYEYIKKNLSTEIESALANGKDILVEEYIDGDEVDVDILLQNGKIKFYSITDNFQTREPFFVETGEAIPSGLPAHEQKELIQLAEEVLEKMGVQNGCIHFEAKSTRNGPVPIEANLRMGGDEVYSFVKGAWNVDLIENAAKIACGIYIKRIPKPDRPFKYMAGQYFLSDESGILVKLDINEAIHKNKYVEEVNFYKKIGDPVLVPPEGYEFLGWITVSGDNPIDAQDNIRQMTKLVNFEVAKYNRDSFIGRTSRKNRFSTASLNKELLLRAAKKENLRRISTEDIRNLRIGIAFNASEEGADPASRKRARAAREIQAALLDKGYAVSMVDFNNIAETLETLRVGDLNFILNINARVLNSKWSGINAAATLDIFDIPYAGPDPATLSVCGDNVRVKKLLNYHNIPTPKWDYAYELGDEIREDLSYPLILKPIEAGTSLKITASSIVTNKQELSKMLEKFITQEKTPVLIEEFINGEEYHAVILGNENNKQVLPLSRCLFQQGQHGEWPIYEDEILNEGSEKITIQSPPKNIPKKLESLITEVALDSCSILESKDYAKVKIRVNKDYNPHVIKVNPAPSLSAEDTFARSAGLVGLEYPRLIEEIIRTAIQRYKNE